ncbi:hypothetical protein [Bacteroidetes bacterium endosymbiont of Geopemphigus sp.]|uniref:hypothetical protein n=1 Tax=Bacteroidetes bacterium endosymbiont of Geopemphigus sp. TaxID=2047937 RepID=UPI000CD00EEF|nr:hypothetical protein [Bacteroidetes bacterium endosymbiont of Geopemphigus sp.]
MRSFLSDLSFLALLCLLQVSLFNHIDFLGYINPYIYILFVLVYLPQGNKFHLLFLAFLLGWSIDHFMNTGGLHASSLTFVAYFRLNILRFIAGKNILNERDFSIYELSFAKRFSFVFFMVLLHTHILFSLEFMEISNLKKAFPNVLFNALFTGFLCLVYLSITKKPYKG